ncbi:MAG: glycosyltransferase family 39 protein [Planctomycetes bacterium]|nr:glycosyltransferase family 39 protein [Planctomycetota bacterium]
MSEEHLVAAEPDMPSPDACPEPRRPWRWLAALVVYGLLLNLPFLGSGYPLAYHEALVGERTRGMIEHGRWIVPHLYTTGEPDFNKPPLPFWVQAGLSRLCGGMSVFTLRLPSALACVGTMLLVVALVRRMVGWRRALIAGLVFTTSAAALDWARRAEIDMQLCFLTTASLTAYWFGLTEADRRRQVAFFAVMWLSVGLAVLTKGPLPVGIWLLTLIVTAVADPRARRIRRMLPIAGPLILAAVVVPWGLYAMKAFPGASKDWYEQSLGRCVGELGGDSPFYSYFYMAPVLWLPWSLFVVLGTVVAVRRKILPHGALAFLLGWGTAIILALTFSAQKRIYYILSTVPPMLALAGIGDDYVTFLWKGPRSRLGRGVVAMHALAVPGVILAAVVIARKFPELRPWMVVFAAIVAVGLTVTFCLFVRRRRFAALVSLAIVILAAHLITLSGPIRLVASPVDNAAADIGHFVGALDRPQTRVCLYKWSKSAAIITFYVAERLPVMEQLESMAAWRREHGGGYVVVHSTDVGQIERLGPWRRMLPETFVGDGRQYCLLQVPEDN